MTILDGTDQELMRLLNIVAELSEELTQNRTLAVSLYTQATNAKTQAIHSSTGFVLRRCNLDKPQDVYDSELERMNATMMAENQSLLHDNKQLGTLIKEYEQTLETLMSAFRTKARDVQEHELSLIRDYEQRLLELEEAAATHELATSTALSQSFARLSNALRLYLRCLSGEDPEPAAAAEGEEQEGSPADWSMSREIELARLGKENEVLRRMLGIPVTPQTGENEPVALRVADPPPRGIFGGALGYRRMSGGGTAPTGLYGKRLRPPV